MAELRGSLRALPNAAPDVERRLQKWRRPSETSGERGALHDAVGQGRSVLAGQLSTDRPDICKDPKRTLNGDSNQLRRGYSAGLSEGSIAFAFR